MNRTHFILAAALCVMSLVGCKKADDATVVIWPVLTAFDELAAKAEGLAQVGDVTALRGMLPELTKSGAAVTVATIPPNAKNPGGLTQPLADLADLISKLSAQPAPGDEDLKTFTLGLHPLVALLMQEAGMPHIHANEGPHGGFFHPVFGPDGKQSATLEIKLHDDAGDLEVWLSQGGRDGAPLDLALDGVLKLDLPDLKRSVELRVRDREKNAGEDGAPNVRNALTNYFIFPGKTGADPKWLMGADFAAKAQLTVPGGLTSEIFVLKPHVHHE